MWRGHLSPVRAHSWDAVFGNVSPNDMHQQGIGKATSMNCDLYQESYNRSDHREKWGNDREVSSPGHILNFSSRRLISINSTPKFLKVSVGLTCCQKKWLRRNYFEQNGLRVSAPILPGMGMGDPRLNFYSKSLHCNLIIPWRITYRTWAWL